jgi:serine/threonine protein kinase
VIITELESGTLNDFRFSTISLQKRLSIFFNIALQIKDLHSKGYIHGDLKLENILYFNNNIHNVKIGEISKYICYACAYKTEK